METSRSNILLVFAVALAASSGCGAATIFATGFESSEGYSLGQLEGQNGWTNSVVPVVQNSFFAGGAQAVSITSLSSGQILPLKPLSYQSIGNPDQIVTLETQFMVPSLSSQPVWVALAAYGDSFGFIGQIFLRSNGMLALGGGSSDVGSFTVTPSVWNTVRLVLDFGNQTQTAYADSTLLGTLPFGTAQPNLSYFVFGQGTGGGLNQTAFYDNVSITTGTAPEPGTWGIVALGLGAVMAGRCRRKR